MPISKAVTGFAFLLMLAGCEGGVSFGAPERLAVADGLITVSGPRGYCIDRRLTRLGPEEDFVVLGACRAFTRGGTQPRGLPAVLTATVAAQPIGSRPTVAGLEAFLRSDTGRATISRDGRAETVRILETRQRDDVLALAVRDTSTSGAAPRTGPVYWRAVFALNGRLVSATVLSFEDRPLSSDQGFRKLFEFVGRLRTANAARQPT